MPYTYAPRSSVPFATGTRANSSKTIRPRLLNPDLVERVRGILAAHAIAETIDGFVREAAPGWRVHRLAGERRHEWSVSVSGNWRITFEERNGGIDRVNLEGYH